MCQLCQMLARQCPTKEYLVPASTAVLPTNGHKRNPCNFQPVGVPGAVPAAGRPHLWRGRLLLPRRHHLFAGAAQQVPPQPVSKIALPHHVRPGWRFCKRVAGSCSCAAVRCLTHVAKRCVPARSDMCIVYPSSTQPREWKRTTYCSEQDCFCPFAVACASSTRPRRSQLPSGMSSS